MLPPNRIQVPSSPVLPAAVVLQLSISCLTRNWKGKHNSALLYVGFCLIFIKGFQTLWTDAFLY